MRTLFSSFRAVWPPMAPACLILLASLGLLSPSVLAQDEDSPAPATLRAEAWLALPPVGVNLPALAEESDFDPLATLPLALEDLWPESGGSMVWPGSSSRLSWKERSVGDEGVELGSAERRSLRAFAVYLEVDAFVEAEWKWKGGARVVVYHNGSELMKADAPVEASGVENDGDFTEASKKSDLEAGMHRIVVFVELPAEGETVHGDLTLEIPVEKEGDLRFGLRPAHRLGLEEMLDMAAVTGVSLSGDGQILALGLRAPQAPGDGQRSWIDFVDTENGSLLRSLEGVGTIRSLQWAPDGKGRRYAFVTSEGEKSTLWVADFDGGRTRAVLEGIEDFEGFEWVPDGRSIVYTLGEEGEKDPDNVKRYRGLVDRWGGSRDSSFLYQVSLPDGAVRRLTAGDSSTSLQDISPDSRSLLFTRNLRDDAHWPFSRAELWDLDLATLEARKLHDVMWGISAQYSPDGKQLLALANASAFGEIGENLPEGVQPNLYESQAYLMNRDGGDIRAISRDFDPAISSATFTADGNILVRAGVSEFVKLFRYDTGRSEWQRLESDLEVIRRMDVSADGETVVFQGSSMNTPWRVYAGSLKGSWKPKEIRRSDLAVGDMVKAGRTEDFDYEAESGDTFVGRVYYPPHFDESEQWPAIVYYYGGTSPVTRDFGGRYPKELWAAHGYVVYVLQPSGATGFGQEFAARHVNNWGVTVADEIIEGTRAFLQAHPFVDSERVGCIGASYGGFMTMLLTTRTDLYAAAVSHAGISSLSSYWGEGNWGFIYSAAATAHSYPWNRPDLYVDQSPLFAADQITTPLLLLHGAADDNVPPGESEQMYTALRILGKEVEYIRVDGERHWILQYEKRKLWSKTILAWFDRWLKADEGWWDHLYAAEED